MNKKLTKLIAITTLTATLLGSTGYYVIAKNTQPKDKQTTIKVMGNKAPKAPAVVDKYVKNYRELPEIKDVPKGKEFAIKFNNSVTSNGIDLKNGIKVIDKNGTEQDISISHAEGTPIIKVLAPNGGYKEWEGMLLL